jgi:acyl-CoA synthetase (AMP-forming)/AMP-acid ligase II
MTMQPDARFENFLRELPYPPTIPQLLAHRVQANPQGIGFVARYGGKYMQFTFEDFDARTTALAQRLVNESGVLPGDRVAWAFGNESGGAAIMIYHAALKAAAVNVPINTKLHAREVAEMLDRSGASVFFYDSTIFADSAVSPAAEVRMIPTDVAGDPFPVEEPAGLPLTEGPKGDDLASILYTSGTTGKSKGVAHTHASSLASGFAWGSAFSLQESDLLQTPFPIFSGGGLHFNGLGCLLGGATFLIDEASDTDAALSRVEEFGSTVFAAVPSIYDYWLNSGNLGNRELSRLRLLDFGGAVMPQTTIAALQKALPKVELVQTYGLTEAGPGGTYLAPQYAYSHAGSIGNRGAGDMEIRVIRDDDSDAEPEEVGELLLRGSSIMVGYFEDPEATASVFTGDWLRSGDLVRRDPEGFIYFVDRKKDIIVRGGYNISSVELEDVLREHPAVQEASIFGTPHPSLGEVVAAAVVFRKGKEVDPEELRQHFRTRVAAFKVPRTVLVMDEFPRNAGGKVLKWRLAELAVQEQKEMTSGPLSSGRNASWR